MAEESPFDEPLSSVLEDDAVHRAPMTRARCEVWDPVGLQWVRMTQPVGGGTGGGGGGVVTQGARDVTAARWLVDGSGVTQPVSGSVGVTPAAPAAGDYLPVRLTDGTSFYAATGGGAGGVSPTGTYAAASYRLAGTASSPINLMTIENTAGSARVVKIRRLTIDISITAATAYLVPSYFRCWLATGVTPTGGTQPAKTPLDSANPASVGNVIVRFAASADGTASAIVHALPARSPDREQAHPNLATAIGEWSPEDQEIVDWIQTPITVRPGETLLLAITGNSATNMSYGVKVEWEEF